MLLNTLAATNYTNLVYDYKSVESAFSYEFKTLCQLFEEQAAKCPDNIAIEYKEITLTFSELNALSNQVARYIRNQYKLAAQKELEPNTLIPISVGRSANFIIGMLGILKAGGAYVPINPDYPLNRIQHILKETNGTLILTESHLSEQFKKNHSDLSQILLDERLFLKEDPKNLYVHLRPTDLAYVIYTSGTSGTPKGILAQHANVISQVISANYFSADASDTMAFFSDVSFDSTTFELWGAMLNGAKLFIPDDFFELMSNPILFKETVNKKNLTILLITRSLFDLLYTLDETLFAPLKCLLVGAEALTKSIMLKLLKSEYKPKQLINAYGPSENSTFCITYMLHDDFSLLNSVPIGRPYSNRIGVVVDKHLQLVPIGMIGEIYVGGPSLSKGYLNNDGLTKERFIDNPFFHQSGERYRRIYKTGDLVKWLPDGNLEYAGRNDFQVKLRGYRIELAEIETRLSEFQGIKHSVVLLHKNGDLSYLIGYYVADNKIEDQLIRNHLAERLPDYMIPSMFIYLDTLPVTTNGKLDRKALPVPIDVPQHTEHHFEEKSASVENIIYSIWSELLNITNFGKNESFFDLGGNSLSAMMVRRKIEDIYSIKFNIVELFQHTTLTSLSERISQLIAMSKTNSFQKKEEKMEEKKIRTPQFNEPIAVVGMACRIPGAKDPDAFWNLLVQGETNLRELSIEELRRNSVDEVLIANPAYVKRGAIYEDPFGFDANFFGYSVKDAEIIDPQHRQFLECAWEALEHSGNVPEKFEGDISVFAAQGRSDYFLNHVYASKASQTNLFQAILGNEKDFLSTRLSYKLNLTGPSITLQTACSSSLVSVQMACENLKSHGSDMALAGGVSLFYNHGYEYREDLIESPDGYCRAFDARAKGTVITSGVGVVVLKRLSDAIAQKDTIYAVIKGGAINNDGSSKMAFTAPSIEGQSAVIKKALNNADLLPDQISYIEAHGTGTQVGDPIEWTALHNVYQHYIQEEGKCIIGSVKTNIGHTDSAAGVFGLIKTVLALKNKKIPGTLNFKTLNPEIASFNTVFRVLNEATDWNNNNTLRRAAVSSFGLGGTNAHVILEEYETPNEKIIACNTPNYFLVPFSAKNQNSLYLLANKFKHYLHSGEKIHLHHFAYTAQQGRSEFQERGFFILTDDSHEHNERILYSYFHEKKNREQSKIIFAFSEYEAESFAQFDVLYHQYTAFKNAFDFCAAVIQEKHNLDIKINLPDFSNKLHAALLSFSVQYAMFQLFLTVVTTAPYEVIAEGNGRYLAGIFSGAHSFEEALEAFVSLDNQEELDQSMKITETGGFDSCVFIELGQSSGLDKNKLSVVSSLPEKGQGAEIVFLNAVGRLWCTGLRVDWNSINTDSAYSRKISIPTYCFAKKQYVLEKTKSAVEVVHAEPIRSDLSWEFQLKEMWVKVLGVSLNDLNNSSHFLELGGDSLSFIDLLGHIKKTFLIDMNLEEIIQNNEFEKMLHCIMSKRVQTEHV